MKKLTLAVSLTAVAFAMSAQAASAQLVKVTPSALPVPVKTFDGTYAKTNEDQVQSTGNQAGYLAVYSDGVEACNGNEGLTRPDNGEPLQGYIWVGKNHAASNQTASDPSDTIGAGNGDTDNDGVYEYGEGDPCPQGSS